MRVVIDTNVLVAAAWRNRRPEALIRWLVDRRELLWLVSPSIVDEYCAVVARPKFGLAPGAVQAWAELVSASTTLITGLPDVTFDRDPKDAKFIACALVGGADFLITGDSDFGDAAIPTRLRVISVAAFCEEFGIG